MNKEYLELYTDYLISTFGYATATGLSRMVEGEIGKAPVRRVTTQNNPVFAVLYAVFKLECLKMKQHLSHFALRTHLYFKAIRVAFDELQTLNIRWQIYDFLPPSHGGFAFSILTLLQ
ncbi:MAG: hypothetical protein ABSF99_03960 [Anaerolineales bacterium]|jgi:hypothetical protein